MWSEKEQSDDQDILDTKSDAIVRERRTKKWEECGKVYVKHAAQRKQIQKDDKQS